MYIWSNRVHVEFSNALIYLQFEDDFIPDWYLLRVKWKENFKKQTPASCVSIYFKTIYTRTPSINIWEMNI
jgi:hypothetical protein